MKKRILSVDIFRGLTIALMILVNTPGTWSAVYPPLRHAEWHGYTPTDLVFPFFLFIVGTSIVFAYRNKPVNSATYRKIAVRTFKLIGLGLFLGAFTIDPPFIEPFESIRFPGVLQRIGVVFCLAALLFLHTNWKVLLGIAVVILLLLAACIVVTIRSKGGGFLYLNVGVWIFFMIFNTILMESARLSMKTLMTSLSGVP